MKMQKNASIRFALPTLFDVSAFEIAEFCIIKLLWLKTVNYDFSEM